MTPGTETVLAGDCRALMPAHGPFDLILADPPYCEIDAAMAVKARARIAAVLPLGGSATP